MLDFMCVLCRDAKSSRGKEPTLEVFPRFIVKKTTDLMIRGGDFYAIWDEDAGLWSTDEYDAVRLIDRDILKWADEHDLSDANILLMQNADSGVIDRWHKYCQKQLRDSYHSLDDRVIFSDTEVTKETYASKRLSYPLIPCETPSYDDLMSTLYSPEERRKIEWAIGAIVTGDSTWIQKFLVLYGAAGTGKSTVLNIIQQLFDGYYSTFDSEALGSSSNVFALEAFKSNPLVAIQHDGNLARIETNTRLNSLVSHEEMAVNEKFRSIYMQRFRSFLLMGTNKPVKITDAKSGLIRRIIDVSPTGDKVPFKQYTHDIKQIKFELGGIACHCRDVYLEDPEYYDDYIPLRMLEGTNDFYNFVLDSWDIFHENDETTLKAAWELYRAYCDEAKVQYPYPRRVFREELKNYFEEFYERGVTDEGVRVRSWYKKFKPPMNDDDEKPSTDKSSWLIFDGDGSVFNNACADCKAQYANKHGVPNLPWDSSETRLRDIDPTKLHYVMLPQEHIVIDFDLKDENGNKALDINAKAAASWPPTYAEVSKSGNGIHLHYIYDGDASKLARVYSDGIEIKVFSGKSSLRRISRTTNSLPIAHISSGLPLSEKKGGKMVEEQTIKNERQLRALIRKSLNKEIHPNTKPSMDFISHILDEAYESGLHYDVYDMADAVYIFAMNSTNNSDYCLDLFRKMKWQSEDIAVAVPPGNDDKIVFFDCEVYPNFFCVVLKWEGEDSYIRLVNPSPAEIENITKLKLVGFNNLSYDNQILWGRMMGYSNEQLYALSQRIIQSHSPVFNESRNLSYSDVYDFCSKKQSLKKWEIELGIHHQEMGIPWDKPVPENMKKLVVEYCENDVAATEAVFHARNADFIAREILADIAGGTPNDRTNALTTKIIFGNERHPELVYTDLSKEFPGYEFVKGEDNKMHNMYRGVDLGFGGYVYAEPGIYRNVALLDIASLHPNSAINLNYFGKYTPRFKDILDARIAIKHGDYDTARTLFDGRLAKYLTDESQAKALSFALKIAINSVYGLTSARFDNPFKDKRNVNNIVALRGALFMKTLQDEVVAQGYQVAHIKTDSIKIPNATPDIISFCMEFAKDYGYTFEHEATYDKMCLVNDAVYIAHGSTISNSHANEWTATGKQFQIPYVFKSLFSKEPIEFDDMCVTQATKDSLYLDFDENLPDVSAEETDLELLTKAYRDDKALAKYTKKHHLEWEPSTKELDAEWVRLEKVIASGHNYIFVGRVGNFVPVKDGTDGGKLYRCKDGKYYYAAGCKGYRWKESEVVRQLGLQGDIDTRYFEDLVSEAKATIEKYGDFEAFFNETEFLDDVNVDIPF